MRMYDIIAKKRDGHALSEKEITFFVNGYTRGEIPDYQVSALLMAICFNGMNEAETRQLTMAMRDSGDRVDLSMFGGKTVDKHSTGGVGDKTSLIVAPLAASLGCKVAKMSGRGLGHTGGTVDKLESIAGFRTTLTAEEFHRQVENNGIAVVGQSGNLAPADKKLYALRDVTATVSSIPLIASSIMSKKLAAGSDHIVLDVKVGAGAFMKEETQARELARTMVEIGKGCGRHVRAVLTDMETPLGCAVGNALEVKEAVAVLKGDTAFPDLREVSVVLATQMVASCLNIPEEDARLRVEEALTSGKAYATFCEWVTAQGGDVEAIEQDAFGKARYAFTVTAAEDGYITAMDAEKIGECAVLLGAGRRTKEDTIDPTAGLILHRKTGDVVKAGDPIATLYSSMTEDVTSAKALFTEAVSLAQQPPQPRPLIYGVMM